MKSPPSFALPARLLFILLASAPSVFAATLTVTTNGDDGPGSLRQAVSDAASGDTIDFDMTRVVSPIALNDILVMAKDLTVAGPGSAVLTIAGPSFFKTANGANASFSGLTLGTVILSDGGKAVSVSQCIFSDANAASAVDLSGDGNFTVTDCTFLGFEEGIDSRGTLTITNCLFPHSSNPIISYGPATITGRLGDGRQFSVPMGAYNVVSLTFTAPGRGEGGEVAGSMASVTALAGNNGATATAVFPDNGTLGAFIEVVNITPAPDANVGLDLYHLNPLNVRQPFHFGSEGVTVSALRGALSDTDRESRGNLLQPAGHFAPCVADRVPPATVGNDGTLSLIYQLCVNTSLMVGSVEQSSDRVTWTTAAMTNQTQSHYYLGNTTGEQATLTTEAPLYFRLRVTRAR